MSDMTDPRLYQEYTFDGFPVIAPLEAFTSSSSRKCPECGKKTLTDKMYGETYVIMCKNTHCPSYDRPGGIPIAKLYPERGGGCTMSTDRDRIPVAASINPKPGDRDRIQPPTSFASLAEEKATQGLKDDTDRSARKYWNSPKTRTVLYPTVLTCPDCGNLMVCESEGGPQTAYLTCLNCPGKSNGIRYKVPTIELEIIDEQQSSLPIAAPVDADAGAAPSLGELFASEIARTREEILRAFVAKYGCGPDEIEQVTRSTPDGTIWSVRRKQREAKPTTADLTAHGFRVEDQLPEPYVDVWALDGRVVRAFYTGHTTWFERFGEAMELMAPPTHWKPIQEVKP